VKFVGSKLTAKPAVDEVEVSIFGPGFGECIVVHLGFGEWAVIDSCLSPDSKTAIALDYLNSIGARIETDIKVVIVSHWHDDHIHGVASVVQAAKSAIVVCTPVVQSKELEPILAAWRGTSNLPFGSGVDELTGVLNELRRRAVGSKFPVPMLAGAGKVLWERKNQFVAGELRALSPSDASSFVTQVRALMKSHPREGRPRVRIPNPDANANSVVVSLSVENCTALLGGDMETHSDRAIGWYAIVDRHSGSSQNQIFKIPHHGSKNAHEPEVWAKMLIPNPIAVIAPVLTGTTRLPSEDDCRRIIAMTDKAYLTAPPRSRKFTHSEKTVDKMIHEVARRITAIPGRFGMVRLRKKSRSAEDWKTELFGDAVQLSESCLRGGFLNRSSYE
jgi:hypothetical protein